jgi:hypothetical protein
VYFMLIEIDTFEVTGNRWPSVELVRDAIEKALGDQGRLPCAVEFDRLMWLMREGLEAEGKWHFDDGDGIRIRVRRYPLSGEDFGGGVAAHA